eukprot:gene11836-2370_t
MEAKTSSPANPWFSEDQLGEGKDLYYSSATGSGKSLIFQCILPLRDLLHDQVLGTSSVLVISPLKSLMLDQVNKLQQSAVSAAAIYNGQSQSVLDRIVDGQVSLVYISPEDLLDHKFWRSVLKGLPGGSKEGTGVPFRRWFGNLIEIKSLLNNPRLAVFTATASKSTKGKIFSTLQLDPFKTFEIEKCPLKPNLKFITKFLDSGLPIENVFSFVIIDIKSRQDQAKETLIFCRTRKQCSLIYNTMVDSLGSYLCKDGIRIPQMRLMEMYHAGISEQVKDHILKTVTSQKGDSEVATVGNKKECNSISNFSTKTTVILCLLVNGLADVKPVTYPNIHLEFTSFSDKNALILTELEDIAEEIVDVDNENSFWEIKDCTNSSSIFNSMEETYQNERSQNISGGSDIFTEAAEQICSKFD